MNGSRHAKPRPRRRRSSRLPRIVVGAAVVAALVGWQWNPAVTWFNDRAASSSTSEFARLTGATPTPEQDAQIAKALAYNSWLASGGADEVAHALYTFGAADESAPEYRDYLELLSLDGTALMADVAVGSVDTRVAVVHGTSSEALALNAGHLYGTSLPVGGPSTHAVIGAHSGWDKATLFNRLADVRLGDVFTISVMGRTLAYEVVDITAVRPGESSSLLEIEEGRDLVTLTTCYPTHVNTHRLLVRGERTTDPAPDSEQVLLHTAGSHPGFPWWAAIHGGGVAGAMVLAFAPTLRKHTPHYHGRHL